MSEVHAKFWDHLEELRKVLIRSLGIILLTMVCCFIFYDSLISVLISPINRIRQADTGRFLQHIQLKSERYFNSGSKEVIYTISSHSQESYHPSKGTRQINETTFAIPPQEYMDISTPQAGPELAVLGPLEGFKATLKVCFWAGLVFSSPLWILLLMRFIAPALQEKERWLIIPFLIVSIIFMAIGFCFAFFVTIPLANQYLYDFNLNLGMNLWSFSHYLDYTVILLLANGLAFELAVIALFLVQLQVISAQGMASYRRHAIILAFVLAAILTPPDVATQFLLAIPLIALYEGVILYARVLQGLRSSQASQITG